jgi:hypothetical protein
MASLLSPRLVEAWFYTWGMGMPDRCGSAAGCHERVWRAVNTGSNPVGATKLFLLMFCAPCLRTLPDATQTRSVEDGAGRD